MTGARAHLPRNERGYAMVAVVAGIAVMAAMAVTFAQYAATRIDTLDAETTRAQLSAAADAGVAIALDGLVNKGSTAQRWPIDGQTRHTTFAGVPLDITVEDERGKIMLNQIDEENIVWLLQSLGLDGDRLDLARDSFLDWIDQDDTARPNGAESEYYQPRNLMARNDGPHSVDEMADIRGFTPDMIDRFRAIATVDSGTDGGSFEPRTASPLAIKVMTDGRDDSIDIINRKRAMDGQRVAIDFDDASAFQKRPLTVIAVARGAHGAMARRRALVVITDGARSAYSLKWAE